MNYEHLLKRKLLLESLLRAANDLPRGYPHKAELRGKALQAIVLEKRGEHDEANKLIAELDELAKHRREELGR
jgi:hypothetical protein